MKIRLYYCIIDSGDGSAYPAFFTKEEYANSREEWEHDNNPGFNDSVGSLDIEISEDGTYTISKEPIGFTEDYDDIFPED